MCQEIELVLTINEIIWDMVNLIKDCIKSVFY